MVGKVGMLGASAWVATRPHGLSISEFAGGLSGEPAGYHRSRSPHQCRSQGADAAVSVGG